jgi:tRNA 2-thiouridine synthesizing protein A
MTECVLDVRGLSCPLPVLKANKALRGMAPGARLTVLATDPASVADFRAYSRETGHELVSVEAVDDGFRFVLGRRAEASAAAAAEPAP